MSFTALMTIAIGLTWVSLPASASTALRGWPDGKKATAALALEGGGFGLRRVPVGGGNAEVAYSPVGFKVHGTHGYSIAVVLHNAHSVILSVFKRGRLAYLPRTGNRGSRSAELCRELRQARQRLDVIPADRRPTADRSCLQKAVFDAAGLLRRLVQFQRGRGLHRGRPHGQSSGVPGLFPAALFRLRFRLHHRTRRAGGGARCPPQIQRSAGRVLSNEESAARSRPLLRLNQRASRPAADRSIRLRDRCAIALI